MPSACFDANNDVSTHWKHTKGITLRHDGITDLTRPPIWQGAVAHPLVVQLVPRIHSEG